jgi:plasmid stability protein
MSVMIQIRNVPDALHRRLKARAATAGMPLSDYLLQQVRDIAERPTLEEMIERLRRLPTVTTSIDSVDIIRAERDKP